jgi:transcriptional regulator with XRE-family HTH domain
MPQDLNERIKKARESRSLTQAEVAHEVGLSRLTYINIESGSKNPTVEQIYKICDVLKISPRELLFPGEAPIDSPASRPLTKYRQMCLACISHGGDQNGKSITKSKLTKLLYLIDFSWYRETDESMSGHRYYHLPNGPFADVFFRMLDGMFEGGQVVIESKGAALFIIANEVSSYSELNEDELNHIKLVCGKWRGIDTLTLSEFTHSQAPWVLTHSGEVMPYELALRIPEGHVF